MIGDREINMNDENSNQYNEQVKRNVIHAQQVTVIENYLADQSNETSEKQIADRRLAFAIAGSIDQVDRAKLKVIAALLQEISGDASIKIIALEEGSIKLILEGSTEGLQRLKELFDSGELNEIDGIPVEYVHFLEAETSNNKAKIEIDQKSRLVEEIKIKYVYRRNLIGAELSGAELSGASLSSANLSSANLRNANLSSANLRNANLSSANLRNANLSSANLRNADLSGANLINADPRNANLRGADLSSANLFGVNLINADLSGAILRNADLRNADLSGANLSGANLIFTNLRTIIIDEKTKLDRKWRKAWEIVNQGAQGKNLSNIDLSCAYLIDSNLSGSRLVQTNLSFSKLNYANLSQANLIGANLNNADLTDADLTDADLTYADLSGANVEKARFGDNSGISGSLKRDLIARGAIFVDPPGDRSRVLTPIS